MIFVLDAQRFLALNEREFIELYLAPLGQDNVIYVANKINLFEPDERDDEIRLARRLAERYLDRDDRLFFINAKGGLQARRNGDERGWDESGLAAVGTYLERFLVDSRGRAKIVRQARELRSAMNHIRKDLRAREGLLDLDREELRRRYANAQEPLRLLERQRDEIVRTVENHNAATRQAVVQAVFQRLHDSDDQFPALVDEIEPENKLTLNPLTASTAHDRFTPELARKVSHRLRVALSEWMSGDVRKLLLERAESLERHIGRDLEDFARNIDQVRSHFNEIGVPEQGKEPSGQRLAARITVLLRVDVTTVYAGSVFGFKEMAKSAVPRLAITFASTALAMNPLVIGVRSGTAHIDGLIREDAERVAARLDEQLAATSAAVSTVLANEVRDVRAQVEAVLKEKTMGEARVLEAKKQLARFTAELDSISEGLNDLIQLVVA